jgi:hypothetical protein
MAAGGQIMGRRVYCDNNFVITAHDSPEEYKAHLRELASSGKVRFVLSPWHWREMARDADHARGTSVADFCDSLSPAWLHDRRTIQKKEVTVAFYRFVKVQADMPVMVGDISEIIHDLIGTKTYRNCRSFVEHLRAIGPNHPMETTFKNAFESNQRNTEDFLAGKLTPQFLIRVERVYIEGLLPAMSPGGISIDEATKRAFLSSYMLSDLPAIALETKITHENWALKRQLNQNNFLDQLHVMALPYVDLCITNDDKLSRLMKRAVDGMPFRTAEVLTKDEFDARFPLTASAKTIPVEEQIRVRAYLLYVHQGRRRGFALDDWLQAEAEILVQDARQRPDQRRGNR